MQNKLNEFERIKVQTLFPKANDLTIIGTKWVFRNESDEDGMFVRNKAR